MAYIYQVAFDLRPDQMEKLVVGESLEKVIGALRSLLPAQVGFINVRAMYSLVLKSGHETQSPLPRLVIESTWQTWDDINFHRNSDLAEERLLTAFGPQVSMKDLSIHVFTEVD